MTIEVLITFAVKTYSEDYPLCVVIIKDGKRSQEHLIRSIRDGRILGNGICTGMMAADPYNRDFPVNPVLDPRLEEVK